MASLNKTKLATRLCIGVVVSLAVMVASVEANAQTMRVGAFPNITHAQAMVGKANGWFQKAMGPQVKIQWTSFNAGPSAIEALFGDGEDYFSVAHDRCRSVGVKHIEAQNEHGLT